MKIQISMKNNFMNLKRKIDIWKKQTIVIANKKMIKKIKKKIKNSIILTKIK